MIHQYIDRATQAVCDEEFLGDRLITFLYSRIRESAPRLFAALTSQRFSSVLAYVNFDLPLGYGRARTLRWLLDQGLDLSECVASAEALRTPRQLFERQIRYWLCRPMPVDPRTVVSAADARMIIGSLRPGTGVFIKQKFLDLPELLGKRGAQWHQAFAHADYAILRLTPEKYHYNHTPVAGLVLDFYEVSGAYHSCNPGALIEPATPLAQNRRAITVIQTDVPGGSGIGIMVMVEVAALMIGEVIQAYSEQEYATPRPMVPGLFLERGLPKSLFRPGSSTDVLLFEPGRIAFAPDLLASQVRTDAMSRFTQHLGRPVTETDVRVRSGIARAITREAAPSVA